jgi:hypothetical protein
MGEAKPRKIPPRVTGLLLLAVASCPPWLRPSIYQAAGHDPGRAAEMAVGLLTFVLASTGVLMMIHGATLFDRKLVSGRRHFATPGCDLMHILTGPAVLAGRACDTRQGVALMQARQAIAAARHAYDSEPDGLAKSQKQ